MSAFPRLRPSPSMVIAIIALIAAVAGTAWAAKKIGTKQLKNKAVTTKKIKNGAVKTAKIANGAVTRSKLAASASEVFQKTLDDLVAVPDGITGAYDAGASLISMDVPADGNYVVTATVNVINTDAAPDIHATRCFLNDDGTDIGEGAASSEGTALVVPFSSVTVVGTSDGGTLQLRCRNTGAVDLLAEARTIIASRVGRVTVVP